MIEVNGFIEVNGKRIPVTAQQFIGRAMKDVPIPPRGWNEYIKQMHGTTITCQGYLTDSEGHYQPRGPVVEGSLARVEGESDAL